MTTHCHSQKPHVLCVTHRVPFPPDRGDRIRTWNVLRYLAQRAHVDLISLTDEPLPDSTRQQLERVTRRLAVIPRGRLQRFSGGIWSALRGGSLSEGFFGGRACEQQVLRWKESTHYTAAYASSSGVAPHVLPPLLPATTRVWIDLMDVDSQKWLDYAKSSNLPMSLVYGFEGHRLRKLESRIAGEADRLLVVTEAERQLFLSFCDNAPVQAVGNGVDLEYFSPAGTPADPFTCAFVGVMDYRPNVDAVLWFVREVWPSIKQRYPEARFNIVGKSPAADVRALASIDGIHVTGSVPDVRPWLHQASCIVVPLRIARGVQNKVLEAMACGRPIVCSPTPLQGLHVEAGMQLLSAETPAEWLQQVSTIFDDSIRADELGTAANGWVQLHHRWDACLEPLTELTERDSRSSALTAERSQ